VNAGTTNTDRPPPAPCRSPLAVPALVVGLALLAAAAGSLPTPRAGAEAPGPAAPTEMPAIRRVLLTADRLADALDQTRQGILRALPRAEFEEKVNRAARALEAARHPPKLAEARYRARLADAALVGTGQWKVAYAGPGPGLLPLQPLNIALRQPRFENRDALIADFDGKVPSLLLQETGDHAVAIEWSARGEERPEGLHFDLKLPASPVAVLELDLPADRVAATADGSLLSGPHAAEAPDRRLWRVGCGGRAGVDLWVRRAGPAAQPTLLLAHQVTTQTLTPEGLDATYRFELEVQHREVSELLLECDPELRPFEVAIAGLDAWDVRPPAGPGSPALLAVRLREPLRHGRETLVVRCLAPAGSAAPAAAGTPETQTVAWRSPGIRIVGAVPRGETLELVIDPDLRLAGLEAGDFRLTASSEEVEPDRSGVTRRLTFAGGGLAGPGGPPRRPAARVQPLAVEYRARQLAWWQPTADPASLTLQIGYEVEYGRLFQLPLSLPPGWDVERVELSPAGLLRNWGVRPAPGGPEGRQTLLVELTRPLTAGSRQRGEGEPSGVSALFGRVRVPTLTARLVRKGPAEGVGKEMPLPDAVPLGARLREGAFGVSYDSQTYQAAFRTSAVEAEREEDGPWGRQVPDAVYQYRGRRVEGTLLLRPLPPRVRAHCVSDVYLLAGRAAVKTQLVLEAESGRPDAIELSLSAPGESPATVGGPTAGPNGGGWRVVKAGEGSAKSDNTVKTVERSYAAEAAEAVAALGGAHPAGAAALFLARPPGERWRLTLARPLRPREPLVLESDRRLEKRGDGWEVPLPSVAGAGRMDGEVTLHLEGAESVTVLPAGLQEATAPAAAPGRTRVGTPWRTFRYGDNSVSLKLGVGGAVDRRSAEAVADRARLTSYLGADGGARHHFSFRVSNWTPGTLPLRMPPGARLVAARVGGHPVALPSATPPSAEPGVLELPAFRAPGDGSADAALRFEIVYDTDPPAGGAWLPWSTVEAPAPVLPVPALTFRRTWRLPPGVDPAPDGRQRRLPGPGGEAANGVPRVLSERFLLSTPLPEGLAPHPTAGEQAEALAAAAAGLRPSTGRRRMRLRELVAEMTAGFLGGRLVVDDEALNEAGVDGELFLTLEPFDGTVEQNRPWEALGLAAVGAGPAPLLTTAARTRQWTRPDDPPDGVKAAVADALANGHDASGHFRTAPDWIRHGAERAREGGGEALPDFGPALTPWTEWEPLAGAADDATLVVVRRDRVLAGGILVAAVLGLVLWLTRWRVQLLLGWLVLAGLGVLWLPSALRPLAWFPLLVGVAAALVGYLLAAKRPAGHRESLPRNSTRPMLAAALPVALAMLLAAAGAPGTAEVPAPVTVFLVPGPTGAEGKETVLAPPDLLERLDALSHAAPAGTGPVLLAASYRGEVAGVAATFDAAFEAFSPAEGPAPLTLTLDGVYLEGDVLVDGARALPAALPAPQPGFAVPLQGAGRHKVELRFVVSVTEEGGGRAVRFGAPRAIQSHLHLTLPPTATAVQALVKHGEQQVTAGAGGSVVLDAELGRVAAPLHVRWTQDDRPGNVEVREAYLWELSPDGSTLSACLDYRVGNGIVSTLAVDLPPGLEVQSAEARRVVGSGDPVRLRDWRVSGAGPARVLELALASPATGAFQILLTLAPATPLETNMTLPLPAPRGHVSAERSHVAYRARGLTVALEGTRWLTGGPAEAFAPFWSESNRPDLRDTGGGEAVYAATFRREGGQGPLLRLRLAAAPPRLVVERQEVTVRVAARHAEVEAALRVAAPEGELAAIACLLRPAGMTVSAVRGSGVRRWTQTGDMLAIWMKGGTQAGRKETTAVDVTAWHPFDGGNRLEIPSVRVEGAARVEPAHVRLVPEAGLTLTPTALEGLRPVASAEPELAFVARGPDYTGACEVRAGAAGVAVHILTVAEVRDQRLAFRSTVEYAVERGELRSAAVQLRNWDGEDVNLEVEKSVSVRQRRRATDRTWSLELPPGVKGHYRLTLSGSVSLEEAAVGVPMPEVSVPGSAAAASLVVVEGADLSAEGAEGLTAAESPAAALKDWPGEADRVRLAGGQVWTVASDKWRLRLRPRGGAGAGPVRVLLADHTAVVADGRHWLHETLYWVRHGANTDLNVILPQPGTVMSVGVDGVDVAPLQPERQRLWLPLPGRAGVRAVRVRWRYDPEAEPLERPLLQTPSVDGAVAGPALWTVFLPAGFEAAAGSSPALLPGPARAAAAALYRAEAQLRVSAALAETVRSSTPAGLGYAQQRFYAACRHAEQDLQLTDDRTTTGPAGDSLPQWHRSLLDENRRLAKEFGFEEVRAEAERRAEAAVAAPRPAPEEGEPAALTQPGPARIRGPLPDSGTPAYLGLADPQVTPVLTLRPREAGRTRQLLADSAAWLGLLLLAGTVALMPGLSARLRPFWPEPLLLAGALAWYASGLTAVAALFLLLGVAGRILTAVDGVRGLLRKRRPAPPPSGVASVRGSAS
jgi:hypothetical protein